LNPNICRYPKIFPQFQYARLVENKKITETLALRAGNKILLTKIKELGIE
jgi:hypothetical protein